MILGQLRMGARQAKNAAPMHVQYPKITNFIFFDKDF